MKRMSKKKEKPWHKLYRVDHIEAQLIHLGLWDGVVFEPDSGLSDNEVVKARERWMKRHTRKKVAEARAEIVLRVENLQLLHMQSQDPMEIWHWQGFTLCKVLQCSLCCCQGLSQSSPICQVWGQHCWESHDDRLLKRQKLIRDNVQLAQQISSVYNILR